MKVTKNQRAQRRPLRQKTGSFGRVDGSVLLIAFTSTHSHYLITLQNILSLLHRYFHNISDLGDGELLFVVDGLNAQSKINALRDEIGTAISKYKDKVKIGKKGEVWVRGFYADAEAVINEFNKLKEPNFNYSINKEFISEMYCVDGTGIVTKLDW